MWLVERINLGLRNDALDRWEIIFLFAALHFWYWNYSSKPSPKWNNFNRKMLKNVKSAEAKLSKEFLQKWLLLTAEWLRSVECFDFPIENWKLMKGLRGEAADSLWVALFCLMLTLSQLIWNFQSRESRSLIKDRSPVFSKSSPLLKRNTNSFLYLKLHNAFYLISWLNYLRGSQEHNYISFIIFFSWKSNISLFFFHNIRVRGR